MTPDPYAGVDLLADVFDAETIDAPKPIAPGDRGFGTRYLYPALDDPRWEVEARFNVVTGELCWVGNVRRRNAP